MNHTELEQRLRAAYRARAEAVTEQTLTHEAPDLEQPTRSSAPAHRSIVAPLLAAAAVVLLALGALVIAHYANHKAAPADHRLRFTTPDVKTLSGVAPGWSVALWAPTAQSSSHTVYLVSPTGERQKIVTIETPAAMAVDLNDISRDHSRVAITSSDPGLDRRTTVITVDLRTRTQRRFTIPLGWLYLGFDAADGGTHLVSKDSRTVRILDASGAVRSTRPARAGVPVTVNGQPAVLDTAAQTINVKADTGRPLASLLSPGKQCRPVRPWTESSLLALCSDGFWALPLDGSGAPARLAKVGIRRAGGFDDFPYFLRDLVRIDGQLFALESPSCGGGEYLAPIGADLKPHHLGAAGHVPGGAFAGVTDDAYYYVGQTSTGCEGTGGTLYRYTPAQHRVTPVLGAGAGGGTVRRAITIEPPDQLTAGIPER